MISLVCVNSWHITTIVGLPQIPKFQLVFSPRLGMYKKMSIEQSWLDIGQINDWWIDIDQLFEQIQVEIDSVDNDHDESNNTQQIEQLTMSLEHLNALMKQIQANTEQQRIADTLREQFEELRSRKHDLNDLRSQIQQPKPKNIPLDPQLYTINKADPWQGRKESINTIVTQEWWLFAWFFAKLFAPLNPDNKLNA